MLTNCSESNLLPSFQRLIPFFLDQLSKLDSPTDVFLVRDIVYNSGKKIIKKDEMLSNLASVLSDKFVIDVYSELRGKNTALEFVKSLYAIAAEIRCAKLLKEAGAEDITKCTTPEDVSCTYDGTRLGFQVKFKSDEDFAQGLVEEAIIGEMYKQRSTVLRGCSHFLVHKCTEVREGFLSDSIVYIHSLLCDHLQQGAGSYATRNLHANLTQCDRKLYVDIIGAAKYKGSVLTISFQQNPSQKLGGVKVAPTDQEPEEELWRLLEKKIKQIPSNPCLVGWIDLEMSFQYDSYLSTEQNRTKIVSFLEKHPIPLVLRTEAKFSQKTDLLFSNRAAKTFSLIGKLGSN